MTTTRTFTYKHLLDDTPVKLDVYSCNQQSSSNEPLPVLVYFHGGGLACGNRTSWFPEWLLKRTLESGIVLISADYQLMPPATGYDIIQDITDLFRFIQHDLNHLLEGAIRIDSTRIGVSGSSSGSLCAYLAALHSGSHISCVLSMYGMGGDMISSQYLDIKTNVFFRGREMLVPADFQKYVVPQSQSLPPISDSPRAYFSEDSPTPGYPSNPRMQLPRLYMQEGVYLDYYSGQHEPSLSAALRPLLQSGSNDRTSKVAALLKPHAQLFPQVMVSSSPFPPTLLVHGTNDSAVKIEESRNLHCVLQLRECDVTLIEVPHEEHSFDFIPGTEVKHAKLIDTVVAFLERHVHK